MSPDETFFLCLFGVTGVVAGLKWYWPCLTLMPGRTRQSGRNTLLIAPFLCTAVIFLILKLFSSHDVQNDPTYLFFYMVMGAGWIGTVSLILPMLGLSLRDDVLEGNNPAAAWAIAGLLLGATLAFAGGNIGDGPGWWVVVISALMSTVVLFLGWVLLNEFTGIADTITIGRDSGAGIRAAGFFIGSGLILGRAVAGDWVSAKAMLVDFSATAWPVLLLWIFGFLIEHALKPTPRQATLPASGFGVLVSAAYVFLGATAVAFQGTW